LGSGPAIQQRSLLFYDGSVYGLDDEEGDVGGDGPGDEKKLEKKLGSNLQNSIYKLIPPSWGFMIKTNPRARK